MNKPNADENCLNGKMYILQSIEELQSKFESSYEWKQPGCKEALSGS